MMTIRYPYEKAHTVSFMMMVVRMMWYKANYPDVFKRVFGEAQQTLANK